ncbi:prohibitin family protein [Catalinimonas sp. 4WD22]|uniref:prohibitin family protein n=1 Tax=Catalinimonas locisalis TaxID=3133978 RepID=UPI00310162B3
MKTNHIIYGLSLLLLLSSCTVVRQGEVGVKRNLGKINFNPVEPGPVAFLPFTTRVIKVPVRTVNVEITSNLPSKEGLNVASVISILYRVMPEKAPEVIANIGSEYEEAVIISVFRSASADVCSQFFAKDMHSSQRAHIEQAIASRMESLLKPRGFEVEAVLLKNIQLPSGLAQAVEHKLEAEQDAQRMEFLLQRERLEAQRKMVEAEGIRDAQRVISEGLNKDIIQWQTVEAFKELAQSPNAKVIITNGNTPMLIEPQVD